MSTMSSTMLYDTHMSDYPIDVDMHHAAEPWFDTEAKMDDDIPLKNDFSDHHSSHSVEVDMGDQYAETEYEMADGGREENYDEMSSDLLDIEVYDASEPLADATLPPAEQINAQDTHALDMDSLEAAKLLPLLEAVTPAMSPVPPGDTELPDAVISTHTDVAVEEPSNVFADEPAEFAEEEPVDDEHSDADGPAAQLEDVPSVAVFPPPLDENSEASNHPHIHESREEEVDASHPEDHPHSTDAAPSESRDVGEPTSEESALVDPHEISEGVYIDPPPAVLVSFESSECPDICLFNRPVRSHSPSPALEGHEPDNRVFDVLLRHRPILYYEPLLSVFEALRQEEYLSRIPQLADSELVLDAYDLQLVISEDNVYAREITLHDLNVLHDASVMAGPLRLRLKTVLPRFILRYHLLQDQIASLNVAGDDQEQSAESSEPRQDQDQFDSSKDKEEPQSEEAQEASENQSAFPSSRSHENGATSPKVFSSPAQGDGHAEPENAAEVSDSLQRPDGKTEAAEESAEVEEEVKQEVVDNNESYGEKSEHNEVDNPEAEATAELPEEEDGEGEEEEEEEFVVVETSGSKPVVPLTGNAPIGDIVGNVELEKTLNSSSPNTVHHAEPGPSKQKTTHDNTEIPGTLADDSADQSYVDAGENVEDVNWEDAFGGDEDPDTTWEVEGEHETASNESSVTLSSKASKRSFEEVELDEGESSYSPPGSPGLKRTRTE